MKIFWVAGVVLLMVLHPAIPGQEDLGGYVRPEVSSCFVQEKVTIDGRLTEEVWGKAGRIVNFRQVEPKVGELPSEKTRILICHNRDFIYIGLFCFDRDPGGIRATQLERDARLDPDDRVEIILDSFRSHRTAYFIQIGPGGSLGDGLIGENGRRFSKAWDGIFHGCVLITEHGWQAEIAIPTATIRFDPKQTTWGINFNRHIRRRDEQVRWSFPFRHCQFFKPSNTGDLKGMVGLDESLGISVKPYVTLNTSFERGIGHDDGGDLGGDVFFSVTPSLTAVLTFNTDFAEAEVDSRQVNLTRFPLFFPERRDFFLEAAPSFEFGFGRRDVLPFYSRRIGRDDNGNTLPLYGGKFVGRVGDYGIGVMGMRTQAQHGLPEKHLGVVRFTKSVLQESLIGVIGTGGNPTGSETNSVAGLDFDLRTSEYLGNKNFSFRGYGLTSETEGARGRDMAFGASLDFSNEPFAWHAKFEEIQENFNPELGFVQRTGIQRYSASALWTWRNDGWLRRFRSTVSWQMVTGCRDGVFQDGQVSLTPCNILFSSGDSFRFAVHGKREDLDSTFSISDGIDVPVGKYETVLPVLRFNTSDKRPWAFNMGFDYGTFYTGWIIRYAVGCSFRLSNSLQAAFNYDQRDVSLEEGDFTTRLSSLKALFTPSPGISWSNLVQYDNVSDTLGLSSRLRWIVDEGNDIFLIINHGWTATHEHFARENQNLQLKVAWTFQF